MDHTTHQDGTRDLIVVTLTNKLVEEGRTFYKSLNSGLTGNLCTIYHEFSLGPKVPSTP